MGGKTSSTVKERYNQKAYDRVYVRLRKDEYPTKEDIEKALDQDESINSWIVDAIKSKLGGSIDIPDLAAYSRSVGATPEEYIKQAVIEKMKRQDEDFMETVTRENV